MAAVRIGPGQYRVNGKVINAKSAAEAEKIAGGQTKADNKAAKAPRNPGNINPGKMPKGIRKDMLASQNAANADQYATIAGQNADTFGPFGSTETNFNPETGQWEQHTSMDPQQQELLDASQGLNLQGNQWAGNQMGQFGQFQPGDYGAQRDKAFDTAYGYLTRNYAGQKSQEKQDLDQELYNQGIAFSEDPNSRYQQRVRAYNTKWEDQERNAANQAYGQSLAEQQTGFSQGLQTNQQQGSNIVNMSGIGTGAQLPNQPGFTGAARDTQDPAAFNLAWKQLQIQQQQANRAGQNSSGGGQEESPIIY